MVRHVDHRVDRHRHHLADGVDRGPGRYQPRQRGQVGERRLRAVAGDRDHRAVGCHRHRAEQRHPLAQLGRAFALAPHSSILSTIGASGKPGPIQTAAGREHLPRRRPHHQGTRQPRTSPLRAGPGRFRPDDALPTERARCERHAWQLAEMELTAPAVDATGSVAGLLLGAACGDTHGEPRASPVAPRIRLATRSRPPRSRTGCCPRCTRGCRWRRRRRRRR